MVETAPGKIGAASAIKRKVVKNITPAAHEAGAPIARTSVAGTVPAASRLAQPAKELGRQVSVVKVKSSATTAEKRFLAAREHAAQIEKKVKSSSSPGRNTGRKTIIKNSSVESANSFAAWWEELIIDGYLNKCSCCQSVKQSKHGMYFIIYIFQI